MKDKRVDDGVGVEGGEEAKVFSGQGGGRVILMNGGGLRVQRKTEYLVREAGMRWHFCRRVRLGSEWSHGVTGERPAPGPLRCQCGHGWS